MKLSESFINRLSELAGILSENRIEKLIQQKYPQNVIDFALAFAKDTTQSNKEDAVVKNQYIPWIAQEAKKDQNILSSSFESKINVIKNWIKFKGYPQIKTQETFQEVYDKALEELLSHNIEPATGEQKSGGNLIKKYPNGLEWVEITDADYCMRIAGRHGLCLRDEDRAEIFIGYNSSNHGYMLINPDKNKLLAAVEYDSDRRIVTDVQGQFNQVLPASMIPYIFDLFKMIGEIVDIQSTFDNFKKAITPSQELKDKLSDIVGRSLNTMTKVDYGLKLDDEQLSRLPVKIKLRAGYEVSEKELLSVSLKDRIENGWKYYDWEVEKLSLEEKIDLNIPLTEKEKENLSLPLYDKVRLIVSGENFSKFFINNGIKNIVYTNEGVEFTYDDLFDVFKKNLPSVYSNYYEEMQWLFNYYSDDYDAYVLEIVSGELKNNLTPKSKTELKGLLSKFGIKKFKLKELNDFFSYNFETIFDTFLNDISNSFENNLKEKYLSAVKKHVTNSDNIKYKVDEDFTVKLSWEDLQQEIEIYDVKKIESLYNSEFNELKIDLPYPSDMTVDKIVWLEINKYFQFMLDDIDSELDSDDFREKSENMKKAHSIISDLKFEKNTNSKYYRKIADREIYINNIDYDNKVFNITINYKDKDKQSLKGNVPFDGLSSYVTQYELLEYVQLKEDYRYNKDGKTFKPDNSVIDTAKKALSIVSNNNLVSSDGSNEGSGLQKVKDLASGNPQTHSQVERMDSFFRNNEDEYKKEKMLGKNINNSPIIQKWNLWGGDAGQKWAKQIIGSTKRGNQRSKDLRRGDGIGLTKNLMNPLNTRVRR
jgi:hypothetical protein